MSGVTWAAVLAIGAAVGLPGTITHAVLGHIDWPVVVVFAAAWIPLSYAGARVALRTESVHLERGYGAALAVLGVTMLTISR
jgi:uncharacterized membrane protein YfcA